MTRATLKPETHLVLRIAVVLIDGAKEVVALQQRLDSGGSGLAGGEGHGGSVEAVELGANGFVEEQEDEDWRVVRRVLQASLGGRGIERSEWPSHYRYASSTAWKWCRHL